MKISAEKRIDADYLVMIPPADVRGRAAIVKTMANTIDTSVDISFKSELQEKPKKEHVLSGHIYVLTEYDYQSIKQDFELISERHPKLDSSLKAILQKITCKPRSR